MKKRKLALADGTGMTINDNEWTAIVNRKEFDANQTEIVRVSRHNNGLLTRVYVMRSVSGQKVAEENHMVVADNLNAVIAASIARCGLTKISNVAVA